MNNNVSNNLVFFGAVLVVVALGVVISYSDISSSPTGAATYLNYIKYYGVAQGPVDTETYSGKIQTYFELKQPMLKQLRTAEMREFIANEIVTVWGSDFIDGIVDYYRQTRPTVLHYQALDFVERAAVAESENFKNDLTCLRSIGNNHGAVGEFKVALISELKYEKCPNMERDTRFAYMKHTFLNKVGNEYLCDQSSPRLFFIDMKTGGISTDLEGC